MFFDKKYEGKGWELKDGVLTIDKGADLENTVFSDYPDLRKIVVDNEITKIPSAAFSVCKNLEFINLPESIEYIGSQAFSGCESLKEITIPSKAGCYIDNRAFENCPNLKRIDFTVDQLWVSLGTFVGAPDDTIVGYKGREISVKDLGEILYDDPSRLSEKEIDEVLENLERHNALTELKLPENLKRVPSEIYANSKNLSSVHIPETVEIIGSDAFSNCPSLKSVTLPDHVMIIENCAFYKTGLESIKIPQNVKGIETLAFGLCEDLKKVTIESDKLPEIPDQSFTDCKNLESINIPESVERIGDGAFFRCESLREITIPSTAHCVIDKHAFEDCKNLEKVTLGPGVDSIRPGAFRNCNNLKRIELANDRPRIWDKAFEGVPEDTVIACNGKEISLKDLNKIWDEREASDPILKLSVFYYKQERTPINLSVNDIDDYMAKQAEEIKKPEKKKHIYRGR